MSINYTKIPKKSEFNIFPVMATIDYSKTTNPIVLTADD
jgi:hypothetical protein